MDRALELLGFSGWALVATLAAALFVVAFKGIESTSRFKASPSAQDFIVKVKFGGSFGFASLGLSGAIAVATRNPWIGVGVLFVILLTVVFIVGHVSKLATSDEAAAQAAAVAASSNPANMATVPPAAVPQILLDSSTPTNGPGQ